MAFLREKDFAASEEIMRKTWAELRDALADGSLKSDDINKALSYTFLKQFDDAFHINNEERFCKRQLGEYDGEKLFRCVRIDNGVIPSYDRFLPKTEFIKADNRFSPAGVEWLYLAWAGNSKNAKECARKECRIEKGESIAFCEFEVVNREAQIFDLTIADRYSYSVIEEIFSEYISTAGLYISKEIFNDFSVKKYLFLDRFIEKVCSEAAQIWFAYTYTRMLSSQIFEPVNANKTYMYAPFHCMAYYFQSIGYDGIAYSSTVSEKGKNIVLFNKNDAKPIGDVCVSVGK